MRMIGKWPLLAAALVAGLVAGALSARAEDAQSSDTSTDVNYGPYLSLAGGVSLPQDMHAMLRNPLAGLPVDHTIGYSTGFDITAAFGEKWGNGLRTEIEASYRRADLKTIDVTSLTGSQQVLGAMGNVLYDVNVSSLILSAGGGAGVGHNKWSNVSGFATPRFDSGDTNLQWQAIGEVALPFSTHLAAFADYRYITLYDNKFISTTNTARLSGGTDHSHNVMVGLRYFFNPAG